MGDIEIRAWYRGKMYYHVEYTTYEDGSSGVTGLMSKDERPFAPTDSGVEGMLYIGRKDKNGQKIYEGDIVEYLDNTSQGLVRKTVTITDIRHLPDFSCSKWEDVIGNIKEI